MKEFTFGEIKNGLLCCAMNKNCKECAFKDSTIAVNGGDLTCTQQLMAAAFNCINTMEKDLGAALLKAEQWEEQCTLREYDLYELRASIDREPKND